MCRGREPSLRLLPWREGRDIEDEQLIDRILSGDQEAFEQLVQRYANSIYQAVYGVLQSAKDAEDASQEVFVQIYLSLPRYERRGFKTWMTRIAVNKAIDWKRKLARRQELPVAAPDEWEMFTGQSAGLDETETEVMERERLRVLKRRMDELPDTYREVIEAYYFDEKTYQQIAAEQGLERKSVESRLYRARQWMKANWKEDDF